MITDRSIEISEVKQYVNHLKLNEPVVEPVMSNSEPQKVILDLDFYYLQTRLKAEIFQNDQELKTAALHKSSTTFPWKTLSIW